MYWTEDERKGILKGEMLYLEEECNDFRWRNGKKTFWAEDTKRIQAWRTTIDFIRSLIWREGEASKAIREKLGRGLGTDLEGL